MADLRIFKFFPAKKKYSFQRDGIVCRERLLYSFPEDARGHRHVRIFVEYIAIHKGEHNVLELIILTE